MNILDNKPVQILPLEKQTYLSNEYYIGKNGKRYKSPLERFLSYCSHHPLEKPDEPCLWLGAKNELSYGVFEINGKTEKAHRVAYRNWIGEIPDGMFVCHVDDNPQNISPYNLRLGTVSDNNKDASKKFRAGNKLTEEQVLEIRNTKYYYGMYSYFARKFGVDPNAIKQCYLRISYKEIK